MRKNHRTQKTKYVESIIKNTNSKSINPQYKTRDLQYNISVMSKIKRHNNPYY